MLKNQIDDLRAENGVLAKKCQQTQQLLDKQKELSAAQEAKQRILESQLTAAQAKAEEVQRSEKQASQQFRSKDVRLNRALEELEKLKAQLHEERMAHDKDASTKSDVERLARENKKLEKHKSELLVAFKKQMKLIDLLKRQRIHMEVRGGSVSCLLVWICESDVGRLVSHFRRPRCCRSQRRSSARRSSSGDSAPLSVVQTQDFVLQRELRLEPLRLQHACELHLQREYVRARCQQRQAVNRRSILTFFSLR